MTQEKFKKEWEGVLRGIDREEFAEWCEKFIRIEETVSGNRKK
jgi:hypothetical protein